MYFTAIRFIALSAFTQLLYCYELSDVTGALLYLKVSHQISARRICSLINSVQMLFKSYGEQVLLIKRTRMGKGENVAFAAYEGCQRKTYIKNISTKLSESFLTDHFFFNNASVYINLLTYLLSVGPVYSYRRQVEEFKKTKEILLRGYKKNKTNTECVSRVGCGCSDSAVYFMNTQSNRTMPEWNQQCSLNYCGLSWQREAAVNSRVGRLSALTEIFRSEV